MNTVVSTVGGIIFGNLSTMYADDTSSSSCIKSVNDIASKVVSDIQNIIDWLKANRLSLKCS